MLEGGREVTTDPADRLILSSQRPPLSLFIHVSKGREEKREDKKKGAEIMRPGPGKGRAGEREEQREGG